jgi:hypothetical protein
MKATRDETTGKWTLEGVENDAMTFKNICRMLREGRNFKFARYGDGEIACMMGKVGRNTDQHEYFPDLGIALNKAARSANKGEYMVGIQPLSVQMHPDLIENIFQIELYNADVLHSASINGQLPEFMEALKGRHLIFVGGAHLYHISGESVHIITYPVNCWLQYEQICHDLEFYLDGVVNAVVLLSCSMMAEVIIDRFKDYHHTFIDTGSVFDIFCNVPSRKYHYKMLQNKEKYKL